MVRKKSKTKLKYNTTSVSLTLVLKSKGLWWSDKFCVKIITSLIFPRTICASRRPIYRPEVDIRAGSVIKRNFFRQNTMDLFFGFSFWLALFLSDFTMLSTTGSFLSATRRNTIRLRVEYNWPEPQRLSPAFFLFGFWDRGWTTMALHRLAYL